MSQTKRLSELKAGDHMWWEGEICEIEDIEETAPGHFEVWFSSGGADCGCCPEQLPDGDWAVPSADEVAELQRVRQADRAERRSVWLESRPAHEAKCMAAARRVALAFGKDPEIAEKQMREKLDGERLAFEEEFGDEH